MSEELLYQGQRLGDGGRYIIRQKKDEGGGGIIYLAFDQNLQMEVAVKQIKDGMPSYLESRVEVDILKKLSHQHLPKVLDFVEYDGTMFTVMNYIQGFSLAKALQNQGRFMQRDVLRWAIDISDALAYLHSQTPPVIHSDVKPGNIMYDPQTRQVTLIDFNISLAFKKNQLESTWVTKGYSPPEQFKTLADYFTAVDNTYGQTRTDQERYGNVPGAYNSGPTHVFDRYTLPVVSQTIGRGVDTRSDVYSFGATMYHLLTGHKPDIDFNKIIPISQFNIGLNPSFASIIEKCMALNPDERYKDGRELSYALHHITEIDEEYIAYKKGVKRRKIASIALIAAGAAMMLGGFTLNRNIKNSEYNSLIARAEAQIDSGNFTEARDLADEAKKIDASRMDAYLVEVTSHYKSGENAEAIEKANEVLGSSTIKGSDQVEGDVYFVLGDSYMEDERYKDGTNCFSKALELYDGNNLYYRDYAVCLARGGDLDEAENILDKAIKANLEQDSVEYAQAEIAFAKNNTEEAVTKFQDVLNTGTDKELKTRSILMLSKCYIELGDVDRRIDFLTEQSTKADVSIQNRVTHELADAWLTKAQTVPMDSVETADCYTNALFNYQKMYSGGNRTLELLCSISVCQQNSGREEEALKTSDEIIQLFPDNYRGYCRKAFVLAAIEQKKDPAEKNYAEFDAVFQKARELSEKEGAEGSEDMANLIRTYNSAREEGWI